MLTLFFVSLLLSMFLFHCCCCCHFCCSCCSCGFVVIVVLFLLLLFGCCLVVVWLLFGCCLVVVVSLVLSLWLFNCSRLSWVHCCSFLFPTICSLLFLLVDSMLLGCCVENRSGNDKTGLLLRPRKFSDLENSCQIQNLDLKIFQILSDLIISVTNQKFPCQQMKWDQIWKNRSIIWKSKLTTTSNGTGYSGILKNAGM